MTILLVLLEIAGALVAAWWIMPLWGRRTRVRAGRRHSWSRSDRRVDLAAPRFRPAPTPDRPRGAA
ncbi:hypothetical protein ACRAWF_19450 [Streptomyces sp. L7]